MTNTVDLTPAQLRTLKDIRGAGPKGKYISKSYASAADLLSAGYVQVRGERHNFVLYTTTPRGNLYILSQERKHPKSPKAE